MTVADPTAALGQARDRAEQRIRDLAGTVAAIIEASRAANLDDEHDPEGATIGFERAQVSALLDAARDHLVEIDAALDRVRRGTYGTCARCARPITAARLEARPEIRICVACASTSAMHEAGATDPSR